MGNVRELADPMHLATRVRLKVQTSKNPKNALVVGYIEARDVAEILDAVVGPEAWSFVHHAPERRPVEGDEDEWYATGCLSIHGVDKGDVGTGTGGLEDGLKGCVSDALKRCAVHWGIGRALYRLPKQFTELDSDGRITNKEYDRIEAEWAADLVDLSKEWRQAHESLLADENRGKDQPEPPQENSHPADEPMGEKEAVEAVKKEFDATEEEIPESERSEAEAPASDSKGDPPKDANERKRIARRRYNGLKDLADSLDRDWDEVLAKIAAPPLSISSQVDFCNPEDAEDTALFDAVKQIIENMVA